MMKRYVRKNGINQAVQSTTSSVSNGFVFEANVGYLANALVKVQIGPESMCPLADL